MGKFGVSAGITANARASNAYAGIVQTSRQVPLSLSLSLPPPQSSHPAISDMMAVASTVQLAWTSDILVPRASKNPRTKTIICREEQSFITLII